MFSTSPIPDHSLATFADMPREDSGAVSGYEELYLAN
jgi:hypothetical protein